PGVERLRKWPKFAFHWGTAALHRESQSPCCQAIMGQLSIGAGFHTFLRRAAFSRRRRFAALPAAESFRLGFDGSGVAFDGGLERFMGGFFAVPEDACKLTASFARVTQPSHLEALLGCGVHLLNIAPSHPTSTSQSWLAARVNSFETLPG